MMNALLILMAIGVFGFGLYIVAVFSDFTNHHIHME